jgi:Uma2 family endonuclease
MPIQLEKRYYTPEEYLALEEVAEYKSEYHDGEIIPMTGGTTNHNIISLNFCTNFKFTLRGQNYQIYMADVRLWIPRYRRYTYPDVMVIEGAPVYEGTGTTTVTNPRLIVEVLSKSTTSYDQGEKFRYYRSIPEFREYILIDQYSFHVEQFAKNSEGKWVLTEYELQDSALALDSIDFQISLSDIYEGVDFELSEE